MDINNILFFDIETVGTKDENIIDLLFPVPTRKGAESAPKNYKKEEAILSWIEKDYEKELSKRESATRRGALDIDTAVIRSIGWAVAEEEPVVAIGSEKEVISDFVEAWNNFSLRNQNAVSCGFNSINYDWAVIMRRLSILGLNKWLLSKPNLNRWSGEIDLMNIAWNFGYSAGSIKPMKTLARILSIEVPALDVSGADVADLSDEELVFYNRSDVIVTREIFKKFNGIYL